MRFTDNPELNYSNMDGADILAGTDVSVSPTADRKFTLAGLAKWLLETYAGSTIAGSAQSIKAAIDGIVAKSGTTVAVSIGGYSSTAYFNDRGGGRIEVTLPDGGGTAFASFVNGGQIGTAPAGYRPSHTIYTSGVARNGWTDVYPVVLRIGSDGTMQLYGRQADVRACNYIMLTAVYNV